MRPTFFVVRKTSSKRRFSNIYLSWNCKVAPIYGLDSAGTENKTSNKSKLW